MLCYRDITHCSTPIKTKKGTIKQCCLKCYRFFIKEKYDTWCERHGFKIPVAWYGCDDCKEKKERK